MTKTTENFTYYLAGDIPLAIEVTFDGDDIYEITATHQATEMDIYTELKDVYIREFASVNFITVADDIYEQADQLGSIH